MNKIFPLILLFLFAVLSVFGASNLEVNIPKTYKQVLSGQDVWVTIKLSDFDQGRKDVILDYWISDFNENIISGKKETVAVETTAQFVRSLVVPENSKQGEYTFQVKITRASGEETTGKDSFEIISNLAKNKAYYALTAFLFLIIIFYIIFKTRFILFIKKIGLKRKVISIIKKKDLEQ